MTAAALLDLAVIADVGARAAAERTAQGLPKHVEDRSVLGRVTALLLEDTGGPAVGHDAAILRHQGREGGPAASASGAAVMTNGAAQREQEGGAP